MKTAFLQRKFNTQISCSLNYIEKEHLCVRNLFQKNVEKVFMQNSEAVHIVLDSAKKTTKEDPILKLPVEHRWVILSMVQSIISESSGCQSGYFLSDLNLPRENKWYVFTLAMEQSSHVRMNKLRIIMIREELLEKGFDELKEEGFSNNRIKTLKKMAELYKMDKTSDESHLGRLEIVVPKF